MFNKLNLSNLIFLFFSLCLDIIELYNYSVVPICDVPCLCSLVCSAYLFYGMLRSMCVWFHDSDEIFRGL